MKKILGSSMVLVVLVAIALFGQSSPNFGVFQGYVAPTAAGMQHPCSDTSQVGSIYTQIGQAGLTYACQQTGAPTLGAGAFAWQTLAATGSGAVSVASGKTLTVSNSLTLAGTDATTVTFPSTSITVPGTILTDCGSSASCATPTTRSATMKVVTGTIAFSSATTASVTGISPAFTSATSYACSAYNGSHNYTWNFTTQTTTGFTLTAGTSNSDTWAYTCSGY